MGALSPIHSSTADSHDNGGSAMDIRDFIWLMVLGTAARGATGWEKVCHTMDAIMFGHTLPQPDLVCEGIEEMIRGDNLHRDCQGFLRLTDKGRETLALLLSQPLCPPSTPAGQLGLRVKLTFLDLAPPPQRQVLLEQMIALYEHDLRRVQCTTADCQARGSFGQLWHDHNVERLSQDVAMLYRMAGMTNASPRLPTTAIL